MPELTYRQSDLVLRRHPDPAAGPLPTDRQIRDLQRDLRALGYLRRGIDGDFGSMTERAVRALQHDLLHNHGESTRDDGRAPVAMIDFNRSRVHEIDGVAGQPLVECISELLDHTDVPTLPAVDDPAAENAALAEILGALDSAVVPIRFLLAMLRQESGLRHYNEPGHDDEDTYIVVGLDTNASEKYVITSRGYGAGQATLFHHPPRPEEVDDVMVDIERNVAQAIGHLREKYEQYVVGPTSGTRADDRLAEHGDGPLRVCKFASDDPRFLKDCQRCAHEVGAAPVVEDVTPIYAGSPVLFRVTQYYRKASYQSVPVRANFECDWPYAARRYNGSGINSYHYQLRILRYLRNLTTGSSAADFT